jgi:hypothetical protein
LPASAYDRPLAVDEFLATLDVSLPYREQIFTQQHRESSAP